jgi:hypothetical protein
VYTDVGGETPTTADVFGDAIYTVDARFATPPGPGVEYTVYRVELRG